ncbi:Oligosaccharide translocation protein rft1 [Puttea exsequens]|nr:Oligosaccharide translocation protein rft1 [Puttea exsequens]
MADSKANNEKSASSPTSQSSTLGSQSALSATWLVFNQIGTRALTFFVNQILLRYLSPRVYGVATQLELFSVSILYFSRESLRVALARQRDASESQSTNGTAEGKTATGAVQSYAPSRRMQEVINISYMALLLGLPITFFLSKLYLGTAFTTVLATPYLHYSLYLYVVATILELLSEPAFALAKQQMLDGTRAWAEFRASGIRCAVTCVVAVWGSRTGMDLGVLPFAVGQISYAVLLNTIYLWNLLPLCRQNGVSLFPKSISGKGEYILCRFSRPLLTISATFYGQAIFNQILTSGDTYLISAIAPLPTQGAYALAGNYGGLLARMIFQPIEEASRSLFGRIPASDSQTQDTDKASLEQALTYLTNTLHFYSILSLVALTIGPPIAPILLRALAGDVWMATEAPAVLSAYCYLIPLLATNGILEAFVAAVATPLEIRAQSASKVVQLAAFVGSSYYALHTFELGAQGLVVANVVAMALRVAWSWNFVRGFVEGRGEGEGLKVGRMMPSVKSVGLGIGARKYLDWLLEGQSAEKGLPTGALVEVGIVVACCGLGILLCEKDFLLSMVPEPAMGKFPKLKRYVQFQRERAEHLATRKQTRGSRAQRGAERKKAQ